MPQGRTESAFASLLVRIGAHTHTQHIDAEEACRCARLHVNGLPSRAFPFAARPPNQRREGAASGSAQATVVARPNRTGRASARAPAPAVTRLDLALEEGEEGRRGDEHDGGGAGGEAGDGLEGDEDGGVVGDGGDERGLAEEEQHGEAEQVG